MSDAEKRVKELESAVRFMRRWLMRVASEDTIGSVEIDALQMQEHGDALDFASSLKSYAQDARLILAKVCVESEQSKLLRDELELSHLRQCRALLDGVLSAKQPEWEECFAPYEEQLAMTERRIRELESEQP